MSDTEENLVNGTGEDEETQTGGTHTTTRNSNNKTKKTDHNPIGGYIQMVRFFNGQQDSASFSDFIQSLELASEFGGWNDQQKLAVFKSRLIGEAQLYLNGCRNVNTMTYEQLKEKFQQWFKPSQPLVDPLASYYQCKQRPGEDAKAFVTRLRAKGVAAAPEGLLDQTKAMRESLVDHSIVDIFVRGLNKSSGSSQVAMLKPKTLNEALQLAMLFEESNRNPACRVSMVTDQTFMMNNDTLAKITVGNGNSQPDQSQVTHGRANAQRADSSASAAANEISQVCAIESRKESSELDGIRGSIAAIERRLTKMAQQSQQGNQNRQVNYKNYNTPTLTCYRCKAQGHIATHCQVAARITCEYCNKGGHSVRDCWFRQRDSNSNRGRGSTGTYGRSQQFQPRAPPRVSFAPGQGRQQQNFPSRSDAVRTNRQSERE